MAPTLPQALDKHLNTCYATAKPGAAILVARAGEVLFEGCKGLGNIKTGECITPETNFRLASVSKQFTAMCVQLLRQQGLLKFDDQLLHFFPELGAVAQGISLQHLITHTSGLPDYEDFVPDSRQEQVSDGEVLGIVAAQPDALFTPGTRFRYSNTGYVLLAMLVEKVAGLPYADYLKLHLFEPLGMANTMLYEAGKSISKRAMGYALNAKGEAIFSDQSTCSATKGDGCIYTSVRDYLKWHEALEKYDLFSLKNSLASISTPIDGNPKWHYGMGWFFSKRRNGSLEMYHTGNTCGFSNLVVRVPESKLLIVCFSNIADNPYLLTNLIDVMQQFPDTRLESELVRKLSDLTR